MMPTILACPVTETLPTREPNPKLPMTPETLAHVRALLPDGAVWAAFGASRMVFPMLAQAHLLGGHVRTAMDDTLNPAKGEKAPSTAALVSKARRMLGLVPA